MEITKSKRAIETLFECRVFLQPRYVLYTNMIQKLLFLIIVVLPSVLFADEAKILKEHEWPKTCKAAVHWLINNMDEKSKKSVKETPREDLIKYHRGWGAGIRNNYGLWRGNELLIQSCLALRENEEIHPDSVSMIIIEETWDELHRKHQ